MNTTPSVTVTAGDLRPALAALAKVVKKSSVADPLQQQIKAETVNRNTLRFTGADPAVFFTIDVPATSPANLAPFLLPLAKLQERIRGARADDPVEIRPSTTLAASAFPAMPAFRSNPVMLEPAVTASLLKAFACGSKDETRHVLQGVCLDAGRREGDCLVATDGRHLFSANSFTMSGLKEPVILPTHPVFASPVVRAPGPWELRMGLTAMGM